MKLSILMPVFNEAETVAAVIKRVLDVPYPCEVELVIVDDGSVDATPQILAQLAEGGATVNELAAPFDLTLPAVSKHIKVLEGASLVSRGRRDGRTNHGRRRYAGRCPRPPGTARAGAGRSA